MPVASGPQGLVGRIASRPAHRGWQSEGCQSLRSAPAINATGTWRFRRQGAEFPHLGPSGNPALDMGPTHVDGAGKAVIDHANVQRARRQADSHKWLVGKYAPRAYGERPVPDEGTREIGAARDYPRYEITEYSSAR